MSRKQDKEVLLRSNNNSTFKINPEEHSINLKPTKNKIDMSSFSNVSEIYNEDLAPTSISIAERAETHEKLIIKKIFKESLVTDFQKAQAAQEFPLTCSLDHKNIVKAYEWSEDEKEYTLLMEYMDKADYFDEKIDTNLTPIENEAKMKSYIKDALEGLNYLHSRGIVHGDIKLQNMLVDSNDKSDFPIVKLADFGLSRLISKETGKFYMEIPVGTASYMAPEITAKAYVNEKIDMWALGIALYKMAVAYKPTQITGYKYEDGPVPFRKIDWRKRSKDLQDLVSRLLEVDSERRISAREALQHSWLEN